MAGKGLGQLPPQAQPRTQQDADFMAQQAFNQMQSGMGGKGVGGQLPPQAGTLNEALMGLNQPPVQVQPAPVQPAPVQPATGMSGKGALRSAAKTPQPVRAEQQKVATQRLLQQLASRNRGRGRR
jgi:hypothetical protein